MCDMLLLSNFALYVVWQVQGAVTKVKKRFLANAQVFEKGSDHCLVCFYKKVGSKYILGHDDYYCHLESFLVTPEPVVVNVIRAATEPSTTGWKRREVVSLSEEMVDMLNAAL